MSDARNETYLGDAVYASFDGFQIRLRTADVNRQEIFLDRRTYASLLAFVKRMKDAEVTE